MNDFLSWCMDVLVLFLFHDVTSLLPPSFHRNDISTCAIYIYQMHGTLLLTQNNAYASFTPSQQFVCDLCY